MQLEATRLEHQRLVDEEARRVKAELLAKKAANMDKALRLCAKFFRYHLWVALWEWARACTSGTMGRWVYREETTEELMMHISQAPHHGEALSDCLVRAAQDGLELPMQSAIDKVWCAPMQNSLKDSPFPSISHHLISRSSLTLTSPDLPPSPNPNHLPLVPPPEA